MLPSIPKQAYMTFLQTHTQILRSDASADFNASEEDYKCYAIYKTCVIDSMI